MAVSTSLRTRVFGRARGRCEYCGLSSVGQAATFHVDHVIPEFAGGASVASNLALACLHCSLRKGARVLASDPKTGMSVRLFHPRQQEWNSHVNWNGTLLAGVSSTGHA